MMNLFGYLKKKTPIAGGETTSPAGSHPAARSTCATGRQVTLSPEAARVASLLDNPDLALQPDEGSDPYNSGLFDRGESWTRVNKRS